MNVFDLTTLAKLDDIPHLMDAETVVIPSDTKESDYMTAVKISQLFDMAWAVCHARNVKRGDLTEADHDASVERLVSLFRKWVANTDLDACDIEEA